MTKLLEEALAKVQALPPAARDEIARAMLALAQSVGDEPEPIDPAHLGDIMEGLEQTRRRAFASDADITAAFTRFTP